MAVELFRESITKVSAPVLASANPIAVGIMVFSILVKAYMYAYSKSIGEKTQSPVSKPWLSTALSTVSQARSCFFSFAFKAIGGKSGCHRRRSGFDFHRFYRSKACQRDNIIPLGRKPDPELIEEINTVLKDYPR